MNLNGFVAELAFCRMCDVSFDSSTNKHASHYNNPDATLENGLAVDVKNTVYPNSKLIVRIGKEHKKVNIYVWVMVHSQTSLFQGGKNMKQ